MFERKQVMGRPWQLTISPLQATLTDAFRETQQLQKQGKERLCINAPVQAPPPSHLNPLICLNKQYRQGDQKGDDRCSKNL